MNLESAILGSFRAGILAVRNDGTVSHLNGIGERILGMQSPKVGDSIHDRAGQNPFFHVLSESLAMNYLPARLEVEIPGRDGERQYIGFTLAELRDGGGKTGVCAFFKDLTHVEMAEENESLKERLLLLGQMAAGLAHEIRNPIASINVHCGIVRRNLPDGNEKLRTSLSLIEQEITRVEYIIRECLSFVRPTVLGIQEVRLREYLEGVLQRFRGMYPGMKVAFSPNGGEHLTVEADGNLMEQALFNILSNAAEACDGRGSVTVQLGHKRHFSDSLMTDRRAETILPGGGGTEMDFARISIRDDGPGIAPDVAEKIFIPFFTTKKTGTGIGLPLAQKIIHSHGGVIDLRSEPGKGTEFVVKIPVRQKRDG